MTLIRVSLSRIILSFAAFLLCQQIALAQVASKRVVALGGDITEIVFQLGAGDRLVGRDTTSTFPADAEKLPNVGYFRQLSAEGILSLQPDLILASALAGPPEVLEQIELSGTPIIRLPEVFTGEGLIKKTNQIATALGLFDEGVKLNERLERELGEAKSIVATLPGRPKVLFIINAGGGAPMAAGRDTGPDALMALANAENAFASHAGYKAISLEAAAAFSPEAIALMDHTLKSMGGISGVANHPALRLTPAARNDRIIARNGSYLLSFGPRLPKAIVDFARAIRGEQQS